MNREIKFRFWHLKEKKMIDWFWITQNAWNSFRGETPISLLFDFLTVKKDEVIIQQFTGVMHRDCEKYKNKEFDKHGNAFYKEVYEGDIIEFKVDPSFYIKAKLGDRYIIEYFGAGFFMKPISWGNEKIDAQNYVGLLPPYQTSNMRNHYEVIGNIYENPELLKKNNPL